MRHETVELPPGTLIHYSGLEGAVSFACGQERVKGDWWSQYESHVTCPKCKAKFPLSATLDSKTQHNKET